MSRSAPKTATNKLVIRTASVVAGLIFVLLSSCAPDANEPGLSDSPRRRITTSGDPSGASNDTQFGDGQFGNSYGTGNNTGNSVGNGNTGSNGATNSNAGNSGSGSGSISNNANGNSNIINSNTDCYKADEFVCKVERLIGEKTNKYREGRGLKPLALDAKIAFVSRDWSKKQASSGRISHSGFPSSRVSVYRQEFNVSRSLSGENVAMSGRVSGSSLDDAAAERVAQEFAVMWWNSSGHRANMLGRFKSLGVGVYKNSRGSWYATQIFE
jgi:uncharacterized protein YkwD